MRQVITQAITFMRIYSRKEVDKDHGTAAYLVTVGKRHFSHFYFAESR